MAMWSGQRRELIKAGMLAGGGLLLPGCTPMRPSLGGPLDPKCLPPVASRPTA